MLCCATMSDCVACSNNPADLLQTVTVRSIINMNTTGIKFVKEDLIRGNIKNFVQVLIARQKNKMIKEEQVVNTGIIICDKMATEK